MGVRGSKRTISLEDFERRLLVRGLTALRNDTIMEGKPTEDVDELILKLIDAPLASHRRERENMSMEKGGYEAR